jgi:hypothetical protein
MSTLQLNPIYKQPSIETPMNFPIPNVMAAASNPKKICLNPEYQKFFL